MRLFNTSVLAICLATLPGTVFAEDLSSVALFDFESGIRNLGMGATGVASTSAIANSYYNPASLSWADGITATFESQPWDLFNLELHMTDTRITFGHGLSDNGRLRMGAEVGYRRLHYEIDAVTFPGEMEHLEFTEDYYSGAVALGYQHDNVAVSAGVSAKHGTLDDFEGDDAGVSTLSAGLILAFPFLVDESLLQPRVGASIDNLDDGLELSGTTWGIRNVTRIGAGLDVATPERPWAGRTVSIATASVEADYITQGSDDWMWTVGWEVSVFELVFLRAGYEWTEDDEYTVRDLGVGVGWEFGRWIARADYAHRAPNSNAGFDVDLSRDMYGITLGARL